MENWLPTLLIAAVPLLFAITLHEAAHAYAALYFGDPTAAMSGRISLNPLRHIDPLGTVVIPALLLFLSGGKFSFGYAKPVPVNFLRLRFPKKDMFWVALAGPAANLAMAVAWAVLQKLVWEMPANAYTQALMEMGYWGILLNLSLMVFNLFPLPPLDGGRMLVSVLPDRLAWRLAKIERFGFPILVFLLATGILSSVLLPCIDYVLSVIRLVFPLS